MLLEKGFSRDRYILSMDEGTTFCKASVWDSSGKMVSSASRRLDLSFPQPGWVEVDPEIIWKHQIEASREAINKAGIGTDRIASIGIANQRETTVVWDELGNPVYPAIVWQDRRTSNYIQDLSEDQVCEITEITGLIPDPYFSATKIRWVCDHIASCKSGKGKLSAGTIDSWLIYRLTSGKLHLTDYSNASRTMLFDIRKGKWSRNALEIFGLNEDLLPELTYSQGGEIVTSKEIFGHEIPVQSVIGDQQASLYGHLGVNRGDTKNTYGTGSFLLQNNGTDPSRRGKLITSIAWKTEGGPIIYSVEGNVFNTGTVVDWTGNTLNSDGDYKITGSDISSLHGLYFVPALSGLGAPYWEPKAMGTIFGITSGTKERDIYRSALESVAFRVRDIIEELKGTGGTAGRNLAVDGGLSNNDFLMQFQSDILGMRVSRTENHEATSAGAAYMAGMASGMWDYDFLRSISTPGKEYTPEMDRELSETLYRGWKKAVSSALEYYRFQNR